MTNSKILFLGGGNMARAMIAGLIAHHFAPNDIYVADRHAHKRDFLSQTYKVQVGEDFSEFLPVVDVIILAIKPQGAKPTCLLLGEALARLNRSPLIISVLSGITVARLGKWLGGQLAIVRAMPNTPAQLQLGATGLFVHSHLTDSQRQSVEKIIGSTGIFAWVREEKLIDAIAALSGSGPAYYFYFIELMEKIAIEKLGIDPNIAKSFALQTIQGAAQLALTSKEDVTTLRAQVTSKKGMTEAAITTLQDLGFPSILEKALLAAYKRAEALSQMNED